MPERQVKLLVSVCMCVYVWVGGWVGGRVIECVCVCVCVRVQRKVKHQVSVLLRVTHLLSPRLTEGKERCLEASPCKIDR